jgi:4-diphosphocytidyl-2-C-methyl-D-erythritol kinase
LALFLRLIDQPGTFRRNLPLASPPVCGYYDSSMSLVKKSPCKVNLLLNILGRRPDGFHELETLMHPVRIFDELTFTHSLSCGVDLTCTDPALPTDGRNLVHQAATSFFSAAKINEGVRLHLEKRIPLAAGLGGGSGNAATTLLGLNELFKHPLTIEELTSLAASLGSDVPFFLQDKPALGTGRGERIESLDFFPAFKGAAFLLIHPGFGISSAWTYQQLRRFPNMVNGRPGRAKNLATTLRSGDLKRAGPQFFNSLEAPALEKYPLLSIFQEFLRDNGAAGALMSGSGSTTFAVLERLSAAETVAEEFKTKFGPNNWIKVVEA